MKTLSIPAGAAIMVIALALSPHESRSAGRTPYVPGLGEIMAQTATRHAKLWFAGEAGNWPLAAYELDELREGFEDAGRFHPVHKAIKARIPDLLAEMMDPPLKQLEQAVRSHDAGAFSLAYDRLTGACNACHQATDFGYNVVTRPSFNPFANQAFKPSAN